jgi:hypothetical protein
VLDVVERLVGGGIVGSRERMPGDACQHCERHQDAVHAIARRGHGSHV